MSAHQVALIEAEAAAEEADAYATKVAHAVLFSASLWPQQLWQWLDHDSKLVMRTVCVAMLEQVDACILAVVSRGSGGFTAQQLDTSLVRWPRVVDLTLRNVSDAAMLAPLANASLTALTSLTVRQVIFVLCTHARSPCSACACMQRLHAPTALGMPRSRSYDMPHCKYLTAWQHGRDPSRLNGRLAVVYHDHSAPMLPSCTRDLVAAGSSHAALESWRARVC